MNGATTTIKELFELKGASREAKAYAFLYAAFRSTEVGENPVRDVLDCLIPFIAPYTNQITGKQVTAQGIQTFLNDNYGFSLPLYAVDQLISNLQNHDLVEYKRTTKIYFAKEKEDLFDVTRSDIETEFDEISQQLEQHATRLGFNISPPPSGSWGDALIKFLRTQTEGAQPKIVRMKGAFVDTAKVESSIVGSFIQFLYYSSNARFEKLRRIFMGVLIEDFIASISGVGTPAKKKPVTVFYDTALLMRQLSCSGRLLQTATDELTRYLQDLGFNTAFLSGNESEVSGILDTILYLKDAGKELEGETATAMASGEVSTTDLRSLQNALPERLAKFNIFPANELEQYAPHDAYYQIDEHGFSEFLKRKAQENGRLYSRQNRQNDAGYLGIVMRLRKGGRSRDLSDCGYVFITSNRFLARMSRRYLIDERQLAPATFPPILAVEQIATIAWLLKDHDIPVEKAGRELLINCFAAVKPDAEWFGYFREGMEKITGPLEEYARAGSNALTLQAARRIAQDESFGNSTIVRTLSMAEILARAEEEKALQESELRAKSEEDERRHKKEIEDLRNKSEVSIEKIKEKAAAGQKAAIEKAVQDARTETLEAIHEERRRKAVGWTNSLVNVLRFFLFLLFSLSLFFTLSDLSNEKSLYFISVVATIILGFATLASFADLLRFRFVEHFSNKFRSRIVDFFVSVMK